MNFWTGKRVLVTGIAGFLGSWLADELIRRGAEVVGLVRDEVPATRFRELGLYRLATIVRGDLADLQLLERALNEYEIDSVFHLAAQPLVVVANRQPLSTFVSNIQGTWNILEAARRWGRISRVVVASSDKAYGDSRVLPYREELPVQSKNPYDVSKSCADLLASSYAATFGLPIAVSRCGNFYGGGDLNWSRIIPGTFRSIIRGERPVIRSDGTLVRDYFYISDVVDSYLLLGEMAERPEIRGQAFNFGTETPVSVVDLVRKMQSVAGRTDLEPLVQGNAPHEIQAQYLSTEKARRLLGWSPKVGLDDGLRRTFEWYWRFFSKADSADFARIPPINPRDQFKSATSAFHL